MIQLSNDVQAKIRVRLGMAEDEEIGDDAFKSIYLQGIIVTETGLLNATQADMACDYVGVPEYSQLTDQHMNLLEKAGVLIRGM